VTEAYTDFNSFGSLKVREQGTQRGEIVFFEIISCPFAIIFASPFYAAQIAHFKQNSKQPKNQLIILVLYFSHHDYHCVNPYTIAVYAVSPSYPEKIIRTVDTQVLNNNNNNNNNRWID